MKRNVKSALASAILIFFIACSSGDSPKAVAEKYLQAIGSQDYDGARKYGTEDTGKLLDMMSGFAKMVPDSSINDISFTILEEKINGDNAVVVYKEDGSDEVVSLNLVRTDGKWKVNMTKESMNEAESGDVMDIGATQTDTGSAGQ